MSAKKRSDKSFSKMVDPDDHAEQAKKEASTSPSAYDKKP